MSAETLFNHDETEVLKLLLTKMGEEMKPRGMRRESAKAYETKVRYAADRVIKWLENLNDERSHCIETGEPGKPVVAD
jgi:hypothetical protein